MKWIQTHCNQPFALFDPIGFIEAQNLYRHSSLWSQWSNDSAIELEMVSPNLCARIVEWDQSARFGIERTNVWSLVTIATDASQSKIVCHGLAIVLRGYDVVRFVLMGNCYLGQQAVLASSSSTFKNGLPQCCWYLRAH